MLTLSVLSSFRWSWEIFKDIIYLSDSSVVMHSSSVHCHGWLGKTVDCSVHKLQIPLYVVHANYLSGGGLKKICFREALLWQADRLSYTAQSSC